MRNRRTKRNAWLFDLDGTLVDTAPDITRALNVSLARHHVSPVTESQVRTWVGTGAAKLMEAVARAHHLRADDSTRAHWLADYLNEYAQQPLVDSQPYPGALQTLTALRARGARLALVTNKASAVTAALLSTLGWHQLFDAVIGGDDAPIPKPDPAALLLACERLGIKPEDAVMVGDSKNDVLAARAARMPVIAVTYGYNHGEPIAEARPDALIDSLTELL